MVLSIQGCTNASIYRDKRFNPPVYFGTHIVRPGETLYGIALRYGRDFRELAKYNSIDAPYTIAPGQKINLELDIALRKQSGMSQGAGAKQRPNVTERKSNVSKGNNVTKVKKRNNFKDIKWVWPHLGPILAKFSIGKAASVPNRVNKGIDIGGTLGDPVKAAAAGEVVYAGNGLRGYGNLVIINHNDRYLSAYAHNRKILVREGQAIKKGQVIAELGRSGAESARLHFEIRRDGKPVDPLRYLPSK